MKQDVLGSCMDTSHHAGADHPHHSTLASSTNPPLDASHGPGIIDVYGNRRNDASVDLTCTWAKTGSNQASGV